MEVLEKPSTHFLLPHTLKNEPRFWGVCNEEARLESETAALVPAREGMRWRRERWRRMLGRKIPALLRRLVPPRPADADVAPTYAALASTLPSPSPSFPPSPPEHSAVGAARRESLDCSVASTKVAPLETARLWYGAMLTTCPNCLHVFDQPLSSSCCASSRSTHDPSPPSHHPHHHHHHHHQGSSSPPPPQQALPVPEHHPAASQLAAPSPMNLGTETMAAGTTAGGGGGGGCEAMAIVQPPLLLSATLQLPACAVPTTCTLAVTATEPPLRALAGMAGGGIVLQQHTLAQDPTKMASVGSTQSMAPGLAPQPSPSAPLSFVLPTVPGTPRTLGTLPFQWSVPSQPWAVPGPGASVHLNVQMPAVTLTTTPVITSPVLASAATLLPQVPQSDTDLERLAATMTSLRASGWYYEGLSWQESADLLQATAPGTFLVRDSSDPRFLFSLSVQTERGPTSIRLHYVCGNFRLDAEPRLAPLMPLFDCVVKLVEYYVELTRNRRENKPPRDKEQVWVDARGQMYSHILLRSPLYKKNQLPNLQHLTRLSINKQLRVAGRSATVDADRLPLPAPLQSYLKEYPYMS